LGSIIGEAAADIEMSKQATDHRPTDAKFCDACGILLDIPELRKVQKTQCPTCKADLSRLIKKQIENVEPSSRSTSPDEEASRPFSP
jgi:uncharacterized paraquat-inducible protein A